MQITSKGQVTIPQEFRELHGLLPHTEAKFVSENGRLFIEPASPPKERGVELIEHLRRYAKYRNALTADEIMTVTRGED